MTEPTKKGYIVDKQITQLTGIDRQAYVRAGSCPFCQRTCTDFRDDESRKEHRISGLCQECQDSIFGF